MVFADLHIHSTASDGTDTPAALAKLAQAVGLGAIALTDHDTTAGLRRCATACSKAGIDFVPGIELSADPAAVRGDGESHGTLHILGYFIDPQHADLQVIELRLREARAKRNPEMIDRLRELGVNITYDQVVELAGSGVVGRPHIAQVLLQKGYVRSIHEAFERYIGQRAPAHVRKDRLHPDDAIATINACGGVAVLAHPIQLGLDDPGDLDHAVAKLIDMGLAGIETHHIDHDAAQVQLCTTIAQRRRLLVTGGSDYHGSRKAVHLGEIGVDQSTFQTLRASRDKMQSSDSDSSN
jgi:predicted metal-dependent phosphoesterase TrpH